MNDRRQDMVGFGSQYEKQTQTKWTGLGRSALNIRELKPLKNAILSRDF